MNENESSERVPIENTMFPMFVLFPDEGTMQVVEDWCGIRWHEHYDLEDECTWVWTNAGKRYRLRGDPKGNYWLTPAETDELGLFSVIALWNLRWVQRIKRPSEILGDYAVLDAWLRQRNL